ncbi:MAG: alpha/beta hydrolase [Lachnospiraceae bacterium]|nr:alpha/beta hydrolase [Lachnospiraceae bacterium]
MSLLYRVAEKACYELNSLPGGGVKGLMLMESKVLADKEELPRSMYRKGLKIKTINFGGFKIHIFKDRNAKNKSNKVIFFLPGGGGMARATALHYDTITRIAKKTGATVYMANYPLAPKYNVRNALKWLEKVYDEVLKRHQAQNIIFMGDSAGANLILSLTYRLKKKPGKLIVISPACGLEYGKNRNIRLAFEEYDPILNVKMNDIIAENWCRNVPLNSSDISPEYIDYKDFPPMFFFYGKHELFYPHVMNYLYSLRKQGIEFSEEVESMCHDWALCFFFPEGRRAIRKMCKWIMN